jgi:hypothetical protein
MYQLGGLAHISRRFSFRFKNLFMLLIFKLNSLCTRNICWFVLEFFCLYYLTRVTPLKNVMRSNFIEYAHHASDASHYNIIELRSDELMTSGDSWFERCIAKYSQGPWPWNCEGSWNSYEGHIAQKIKIKIEVVTGLKCNIQTQATELSTECSLLPSYSSGSTTL